MPVQQCVQSSDWPVTKGVFKATEMKQTEMKAADSQGEPQQQNCVI